MRKLEAEQKVYDLIVEAAGGGEGPTGDEFSVMPASPCGLWFWGSTLPTLGGHLGLCAVFPERRLTLLQEPGPIEASGSSA